MKGSDAIYLIEAHTDDSGDPAANQALAEQRAVAVKAVLVAEGIPTGRLFAMAYGAMRPATDGGAAARFEFARMQ
jgi:outer membrane protein OmpA-like peptidoglycan-associated protein